MWKILTTHTGSLPRAEPILRMLAARDQGDLSDPGALEDALVVATRDVVDRQIAAGVDIVSDGELGKPGYSTYVKDRLTGFGGKGSLAIPADLADYPSYMRRMFADPALAALRTPACTDDVTYVGTAAVNADIRRFREALAGRSQRAFLTAASPGVIAVFLRNQRYPSDEAYLGALADAMRVEYQAIHDTGFVLQIDCPDLAMSRHMLYSDATTHEFRKRIGLHVEALNHAVAGIPAESMRMHLCWGNYEGPHHRDVELAHIVDIVVRAKPSGISFVASNPRHEHEWQVWREAHIPSDKVLIPGVIDSTTNFIEHPRLVAERIERFVDIVGADRVIAGTDCGFSTFAGLHLVDPTIVWAKLDTLARGAAMATERISAAKAKRRNARAAE